MGPALDRLPHLVSGPEQVSSHGHMVGRATPGKQLPLRSERVQLSFMPSLSFFQSDKSRFLPQDAVHRGEESKGLQAGRLVELPPNSQKMLGAENEDLASTYYPYVTDEKTKAREFKEPVKVLGGSRSQGS